MKHLNTVKVYYADTDSYGIVWHGSYTKWFEIGRVELSGLLGIDFDVLEQMQVQMPVVELNIRYKSPAKLMDEIIIESEIGELKKTSVTFAHKISNKATGALIVTAASTIVTTDLNGKLIRKMPEYLYEKYSAALENQPQAVC